MRQVLVVDEAVLLCQLDSPLNALAEGILGSSRTLHAFVHGFAHGLTRMRPAGIHGLPPFTQQRRPGQPAGPHGVGARLHF